MRRSCSKTACPFEASASVGSNYAERLVWLMPLLPDPEPAFYDLCSDHAVGLRVPRGWALEDRRSVGTQASLL